MKKTNGRRRTALLYKQKATSPWYINFMINTILLLNRENRLENRLVALMLSDHKVSL